MKQIPSKLPAGFSLIELLVVIAIIGVLAGLGLTATGTLKKRQYITAARAEMTGLEAALEGYKAKFGEYPPGNKLSSVPGYASSQFSPLYFELSGTTIQGGNYVTLDGRGTIPVTAVKIAYGIGGFVNCTRGSGEDSTPAKNFLPQLADSQYNEYVTNNGVRTAALIYSKGGPDDNYRPLGAIGLNPFRYVCPGVNNPGSYDLWVQMVIGGKTNLVCNWSKQVIVNSPLP